MQNSITFSPKFTFISFSSCRIQLRIFFSVDWIVDEILEELLVIGRLVELGALSPRGIQR